MTNQKRITVLAGPTAVGKGTVSRRLFERHPEVYFSVSATTRDPREGEVDGVHYRFITLPEFDKHIEDGDFLEWAVVHGLNKYGSLCGPIEEALTAGHPALLEIDLQGARQLRERLAEIGVEADFVFLAPPSFEELVTRLGMRGTESLEERQKRLETAHEEMAAQDEFDFVVTNHEVDQAVDDLAGIMGLSAGAPGAN